MILQALNDLHVRLEAADAPDVPRFCEAIESIGFAIQITTEGHLHRTVPIVDLRRTGEKKPIPRSMAVPYRWGGRTSGVKPYFLWDNTGYCLGADGKKDPSKLKKQFDEFKALHFAFEGVIDHPNYRSFCTFLRSWNPNDATGLPYWEELAGANVVFIVGEEMEFLHQLPAVRSAWTQFQINRDIETTSGNECVTGSAEQIPLLHPLVSGVRGANTTGGSLISFNLDAFTSYGKVKSANAPTSINQAFRYTSALSWLLDRDHKQVVYVGDATTVFWTEKPTKVESLFADLLQGYQPDEEGEVSQDQSRTAFLRMFLDILKQGGGADVRKLDDEPGTKFFILGLSPNASRLSVRFWHVATLGQMVNKLKAHYDALRLQSSSDKDREFPAVWQLLDQTAPRKQGKADRDRIPPLLSGQLLSAVLAGTPYPVGLINAVLNRVRVVEKDSNSGKSLQRVTYLRAAIIKAFLIRNHELDIPMSLDTTRTEPAYLLGRLFAVLEKTQEDALGRDLNSTIRDRFYSAASATPGTVFPRLLRTYQHHLSKAASEKGHGYKVNREKLVQEIHDKLVDMPKHLILEGQGLFAIGYYHQRQDLYPKKGDAEDNQE